MEYRLTLDYVLAAGRLEPWITALRRGEAAALSCNQCKKVHFPPSRRCTCGSADARWVTLPGTATLIDRSDGGDLGFALVRFDGADTLATVRLQGIGTEAVRGRLAASADGPPALVLVPEPGDETL